MRLELPTAESQAPLCNGCLDETENDGDGFYCEACGLDFNSDGEATYRDCGATPCGASPSPSLLAEYVLCSLPKGHTSPHWHPLQPSTESPEEEA